MMFKIFWQGGILALIVLLILATSGCRATLPPLPRANLQEPGWQVHQGQAVWRFEHGKGELAGDLLVAAEPGGRAVVQFSKSPFPLVVAQETSNRWQVEFPPQNKHYAGRGEPPKRVIWFFLPPTLAGQAPPANWAWHSNSSGWRLENQASGESLEGFFNQ